MEGEMRLQHGDLCLEEVKIVPTGLKWERVKKGFVVEKGEGTHLHTTIDDCEIAEKDGVLYLREIPGCQFGVDHEEHKVEILPPGKIYRKGIELEYDAEADEARKTMD
jgi:hypothetical protein